MLAGSAGKPSRPVGVSVAFRTVQRRDEWRLTLEELGNALFDNRNTVAGAVGPDRANMAQKPPGALDDIRLIAEAVDEHILLVQQLGVLEDTEDLAEEGDGLLVQLLGVADVGRDDLGKGEVAGAVCELGAVLLGLDGELAADGVLGGPDVGVDVVDAEPHGGIEALRLRKRERMVKVTTMKKFAMTPPRWGRGRRGHRQRPRSGVCE